MDLALGLIVDLVVDLAAGLIGDLVVGTAILAVDMVANIEFVGKVSGNKNASQIDSQVDYVCNK